MVAIVSGNSLGLSNTSAAVLGQNGLIGQAVNGANEQAVVNIATGNLVLQNQGDTLDGQGEDIVSTQTYNSLGNNNEGNGLGWSMGMIKTVALSGTVDTAGSTVTRTDGDGSQVVYTWAPSAVEGPIYIGHEGSGANDTISYNSSNGTWTWTDGSTQATETYNASGQIVSASDANGNTLTYTYTNNLLTSITDAGGDKVQYSYNASGNLTQISDVLTNGTTSTSTYYQYDSQNRLTAVITDLSPSDNSTTDGNVYWTHYTYVGSSNLIQNITQQDGSSLTFAYDNQNRVVSTTDALGNTTLYNYGAGSTSVTDALHNVTTYTYDSNDRLTGVSAPVVNGVAAATSYTYNIIGELSTFTDAEGNTTAYNYDGNGNMLAKVDSQGDTTDWTYNANNQVTSETVYQTPAANGNPASNPEVTNYIYDSHHQLVFTVSPAGRVTQYVYNYNAYSTSGSNAGTGGGELTNTIVFDGGTYAAGASLKESALLSWANAQLANDPDQCVQTHTTYNTRGQIATQVVGSTTNKVTTTYVYSPSGQLLQTINGDGNGTSYAYDGLGRLIGTTDGNGNTTTTSYSASGNTITVTSANGLVTTSNYNADGQLISTTQSGSGSGSTAGIVTAVTRYAYDADGNLLMTTNPDGARTYYLYDTDNRQIASIDAEGALTQTTYTADGQVASTITYANPVNTALLVNAGGTPLDPSLSSLIGSDAVASTTRNSYDSAGRLVYSIDAQGYVTQTSYDGASNIIATTAYAIALSSAQLMALGASPSPAAIAADVVANATEDRTTRNFYDADNLEIGTLGANGALTQYVRNGSGQIVQTIAYATTVAVGSSLFETGSLTSLLAATPASSNDISQTNFYNNAGQLYAALDGDGYLTAYVYDDAGNVSEKVRYATQVTVNGVAAVGAAQNGVGLGDLSTGSRDSISFAASPDNPSAIPVSVSSSSQDQSTVYTYTGTRQISSATTWTGGMVNTLPINAGNTETNYVYDAAGNLLSTTISTISEIPDQGYLNTVIGSAATRYNQLGQVVAQLSADGAMQITASSTPAQIAAIWSQYATTYTYDAAGNRTSMTDADGNRTLYYYDQDNRLLYTVNAAGDVQGQTYTNQGQVYQQTTYANTISALALAGMSGGELVSSPQVASALNGLTTNASADRTQTYAYNADGELVSTTDALGYTVTNQYDAFGDVSVRSTQTDSAGDRLQQNYSYNNLGEQTFSVSLDNRSGVSGTDNITAATAGATAGVGTETEYDAFGRVFRTETGNGGITQYTYDQLGRQIGVSDPTSGATATTVYDAFGNVLTQTDFNGNTTTYQYSIGGNSNGSYGDGDIGVPDLNYGNTNVERTITITSSLGVTQTIVENLAGQKISVTDGDGNTTNYSYDADGNLLSITDADGTEVSNTYDAADNLISSTDADGVITQYKYDAANRVLKKIVDPTGLDLVTQYSYNSSGQVWSVTNPNGIVTQTTYDQKGEVTSIAVDPTGLNLVTTYQYDARGLTLQVTNPNGIATVYQYDALGRRVSQTVDPTSVNPTGLNLVTTYTYDADNNVIASTDPNGNVTRYVYDADNRVVYQIDGVGDVTHTVYDADGHVVQTTQYATAISQTALAAAVAALPPNTNLSAATMAGLATPAANDSIVTNAYDADGNLVGTVNGDGDVTVYTYDGNGNLIQRIGYVTPNTTGMPADATSSSLIAWMGSTAGALDNSIVRTIYDARNRVIGNATAQGYVNGVMQWDVTLQTLDGDGNVVARTAYAATIPRSTLAATPTQAQVAAWMQTVAANPVADHTTLMSYDNAGRLVATATAQHVDSNGNVLYAVVQNSYDADGNLIATTAYDNYLSSATQGNYSSTAAWMQSVVANPALDQMTRMVYDHADRLVGSATAQYENSAGQVQWALTDYTLDANGNVLTRIAYATLLPGSPAANATQAQVAAWMQPTASPAQDHATLTRYDDANRVVATATAQGTVNGITQWAIVDRTLDGNGNVVAKTAYVNLVSSALTASGTWAAGLSAAQIGAAIDTLIGAVVPSTGSTLGSAVDRTTHNVFDGDNRLIYALDASNCVTQNSYDGLGRVTSTTLYTNGISLSGAGSGPLTIGFVQTALAAATSAVVAATGSAGAPNRTSTFEYDAAGNLISSTDATGATSTYTYDGQGNKLSFTNALGNAPGANPLDYTWTYVYNAAGQQILETDPAVTVTSVTDPSVIATSASINTAGDDGTVTPTVTTSTASLQTVTTYDAFGNVASITQQQATPVPGAAPGTPPQISNARTTQYGYDLAGRQTTVIDPQVQVYDASADAANLAADSSATALQTVTPTTAVTYDALGNAIANTNFSTDVNGNVVGSVSASYKVYDNAGQVLYAIDANGGVTGYTYDAFGDATSLTRYAAFVTVPTNLGTTVGAPELSGLTGGALQTLLAPQAGNSANRTIVTQYDQQGRAIRVIDPQSFIYDPTNILPNIAGPGSQAAGVMASQTTDTTYDAFGDVILSSVYGSNYNGQNGSFQRVTEAQNTYSYYGFRGNMVAQIVAANSVPDVAAGADTGYLTTYTYDAANNLTDQYEYANAVTGFGIQGSGNPAFSTPAISATDRETVYTYDGDNRKTSQTLYQGGKIAVLADGGTGVTTRYGYDLLGNLVSTTDALGGTTYSYYDALGRVIASAVTQDSSVADNTDAAAGLSSGTPAIELTVYNLDIYGNVVQQIDYANGALTATASGYTASTTTPNAAEGDRITYTVYDNGLDNVGRATETIDAAGNASYQAFDAFGRVVKQWQNVTTASYSGGAIPVGNNPTSPLGPQYFTTAGSDAPTIATTVETEFTVTSYDAVGQITSVTTPGAQATADDGAAAASTALSVQVSQYDAFGEVTAQSVNNVQTAFAEYDNAGRAWMSNTNNGVVTGTLYNLDGQATEQVVSTSTSTSTLQSTVSAETGLIPLVLLNGSTNSTALVTGTRYDLQGNVTDHLAPAQQVGAQVAASTILTLPITTANATATQWASYTGGVFGNTPTNQNSATVNLPPQLASLGGGDIKIQLDYTSVYTGAANGHGAVASSSESVTQTFSADQIATLANGQPGVTMSWGGVAGVGTVTGIQVWKKDLSGQWQLMSSTYPPAGGANAEPLGTFVQIQAPQNALTPVTVTLQPAGGTQQTLYLNNPGQPNSPLLYNFDGSILFNVGGMAQGGYAYTVTYQDTGDTVPTVHDSGSFNLSSIAANSQTAASIQITQLYVALLNRAPDLAGLNYWSANYTAAGQTAAALLNATQGILSAAESSGSFNAGSTPTSFVAAVLNNVLGAGAASTVLYQSLLNQYTPLVGTPMTLTGQANAVMGIVAASSGFDGFDAGSSVYDAASLAASQLFNNKVAVGLAYANSAAAPNANTTPSATDIEAATLVLADVTSASTTLAAATAALANTQVTVNANTDAAAAAATPLQTAQAQVAQLYSVILGRAPDAAGLNYWVAGLLGNPEGLSATGPNTLAGVANAMLQTQIATPASTALAYQWGNVIGNAAQFVTQAFQVVYGGSYTPSTSQMNFFTSDFNANGAGQTIVDIVNSLVSYSGSATPIVSAQALLNNQVAVGLVYAEDVSGISGIGSSNAVAVNAAVTATSTAAALIDIQNDLSALPQNQAQNDNSAVTSAAAALSITAQQSLQVIQLYTAILGRAPSPTEFTAGVSAIAVTSEATLAATLLASAPNYPANLTPTQFVTEVYQMAYGRAPDSASLAYWSAEIGAQTPAQVLTQILAVNTSTTVVGAEGLSFFDTNVANNLTALQANAASIASAAQSALNTAQAAQIADAQKLADDQGLSTAPVTPYSAGATQALEVAQVYTLVLNRPASFTDMVNGINYLAAGNTVANLADSILTTAEAQGGYYPSSASNTAFITQLYNLGLGRAPDTTGLDYWLGQMSATPAPTRGTIIADFIAQETTSSSTAAQATADKAYFTQTVAKNLSTSANLVTQASDAAYIPYLASFNIYVAQDNLVSADQTAVNNAQAAYNSLGNTANANALASATANLNSATSVYNTDSNNISSAATQLLNGSFYPRVDAAEALSAADSDANLAAAAKLGSPPAANSGAVSTDENNVSNDGANLNNDEFTLIYDNGDSNTVAAAVSALSPFLTLAQTAANAQVTPVYGSATPAVQQAYLDGNIAAEAASAASLDQSAAAAVSGNARFGLAAAQLYAMVLNRVPDPAGFVSVVGQLAAGSTPATVAASLFAGSEGQSDYPGSMTVTAFINQLYQNAFARPPEAGELSAALQALGVSSAQANTQTIASLTPQALGACAAGAIATVVNYAPPTAVQLAAGATIDMTQQASQTLFNDRAQQALASMQANIANTANSAALALTGASQAAGATPLQTAQAQVAQLYSVILGRAPDQAGLNYWVAGLLGNPEDLSATGPATLGGVAAAMLQTQIATPANSAPAYQWGSTIGSASAFVTQAFQSIYGTGYTPTASQMNFYTNDFNTHGAGQTIVDIVSSLVTYTGSFAPVLSAQALLNNQVAVGLLYAQDAGGIGGTDADAVNAAVTATSTAAALIDIQNDMSALPQAEAQNVASGTNVAVSLEANLDAAVSTDSADATLNTNDSATATADNAAVTSAAAALSTNAQQSLQVVQLYTAIFGSAPTPTQFMAGLSALASGSEANYATTLLATPGGLANYPSSFTPTQFVTQIYQFALGRAPDPAGLSYWVGEMPAQTPGQVLTQILAVTSSSTAIGSAGLQTFDNNVAANLASLSAAASSAASTTAATTAAAQTAATAAQNAYNSAEATATAAQTALNAANTANTADQTASTTAANTSATAQTALTNASNAVTTAAAAAPVTPANTAATQALEVAQVYTILLNASATVAQMQSGIAYLNSGYTVANLADSVLSTSAAQSNYPSSGSNTAFVTELYNLGLGRAPDTAGLNYWLGQMSASPAPTRGTIVANFIAAAATNTATTTQATGSKAYFTQMVANYLATTAALANNVASSDSTALNTAVNNYNTAVNNLDNTENAYNAAVSAYNSDVSSENSLAASDSAGAQALSNISSQASSVNTVVLLFAVLMGRAPSPSELNSYLPSAGNPTSLAQTLLSISPYYPSSYTPAQFVTQIYVMATGNAPTTAGLNYWVAEYPANSNATVAWQILYAMDTAPTSNPNGAALQGLVASTLSSLTSSAQSVVNAYNNAVSNANTESSLANSYSSSETTYQNQVNSDASIDSSDSSTYTSANATATAATNAYSASISDSTLAATANTDAATAATDATTASNDAAAATTAAATAATAAATAAADLTTYNADAAIASADNTTLSTDNGTLAADSTASSAAASANTTIAADAAAISSFIGLEQSADAAGIAAANAAMALATAAATLSSAFAASTGTTSVNGQSPSTILLLTQLSTAISGAAPSFATLNQWLTTLDDQGSTALNGIVSGMLTAAGYQISGSSAQNTTAYNAFLNTLYQTALGIPANAAAQAYWDPELASMSNTPTQNYAAVAIQIVASMSQTGNANGLTFNNKVVGVLNSLQSAVVAAAAGNTSAAVQSYLGANLAVQNASTAALDQSTQAAMQANGNASLSVTVAQLYLAVLGNGPDPVGFTNAVAQLAGGATAATVAAGLFGSAAGQAAYPGSMSVTAFVDQFYQNAFGRPPETAELTAALQSLGVSAAQAGTQTLSSLSAQTLGSFAVGAIGAVVNYAPPSAAQLAAGATIDLTQLNAQILFDDRTQQALSGTLLAESQLQAATAEAGNGLAAVAAADATGTTSATAVLGSVVVQGIVSNPSGTTHEVVADTKITYDRWGNAISVSDPGNAANITYTTYNAYNEATATYGATTTVVDPAAGSGMDAGAVVDSISYATAVNGVPTSAATTTTTTYDALGRVIASTDANGNLTQTEYDGFGNVARVIDADGGVNVYTNNAFGERTGAELLQQTGSGNGSYTYSVLSDDTYAYDLMGHEVESSTATVALGQVNVSSEALRPTDNNSLTSGVTGFTASQITLYGYDQLGRRIVTLSTDSGNTALTGSAMQTALQEDDAAGILQQVGFNSAVYQAQLTSSNQSTSVLLSSFVGNVSYTQYDLAGNVSASIDGDGNVTSYGYDDLHNKLAETDADGNTQAWSYQAGTSRVLTSTAMNGIVTADSYNQAGQLLSQIAAPNPNAPLVAQQNLSYTYNGVLLASITDNNDNIDAQAGVEGVANSVTTYAYDEDGNQILTRTVVATGLSASQGQATEIAQDDHETYDAEHRVTQIEDSRYDVHNAYDNNGNLVETDTDYIGDSPVLAGPMGVVSPGPGTTSVIDINEFDDMNRETLVDGAAVLNTSGAEAGQEEIDNTGSPVGVIAAGQGHQVAYNAAGQRISDEYYGTDYNGGLTTTETYAYNEAGELTQIARDGYVIDNIDYNGAGQMTASGATNAGVAADSAVVTGTVNLDNPSNPTSSTRTLTLRDKRAEVSGNAPLGIANAVPTTQATILSDYEVADSSQNYAYDFGGRLQAEHVNSGQGIDIAYGYDGVGNATAVSTNVHNSSGDGYIDFVTTAWAANAGYQEKTVTGQVYNQGTTLTTSNETLYGYDDNGNINDVIVNLGSANETSTEFTDDIAGRVLDSSAANISTVNGVTTVGAATVTHTLIANGQSLGSSGQNGAGTNTIGTDPGYTTLSASINNTSAQTYIVQAGDTWASIANAIWGDSSLGWAIQAANGNLTLATAVGSAILVPPKPDVVHNNATTTTPYNLAGAIGNTTPAMPVPPPPPSGGNNLLDDLLEVAAAAAVIAFVGPEVLGAFGEVAAPEAAAAGEGVTIAGTTYTAASVAEAGAIAGAAGSLVSQVAGNALGIQSGISLGQIAMGAIGGAIGGALSGTTPFDSPASSAVNVAAHAVEADVAMQGLDVVVGAQQHFQWSQVAAAGISAGITQAMNTSSGMNMGIGVNQFVGGAVANVLTGGQESYAEIGTDAFGNALGNYVGENAPAAMTKLSALLAQNNNVSASGGGTNLTADQLAFYNASVAGPGVAVDALKLSSGVPDQDIEDLVNSNKLQALNLENQDLTTQYQKLLGLSLQDPDAYNASASAQALQNTIGQKLANNSVAQDEIQTEQAIGNNGQALAQQIQQNLFPDIVSSIPQIQIGGAPDIANPEVPEPGSGSGQIAAANQTLQGWKDGIQQGLVNLGAWGNKQGGVAGTIANVAGGIAYTADEILQPGNVVQVGMLAAGPLMGKVGGAAVSLLNKVPVLGADVGAALGSVGKFFVGAIGSAGVEEGIPSFASVYAKAPAAKLEIDAIADNIASMFDGATVAKAPIKSEARAIQKMNDWFGGDPTLINDLARNTIVVSPSQIDAVTAELGQLGANVRVITADMNPLGYSGVNSTIQTSAGILGEIQVNTPAMIYAKESEAVARQIIGDDLYNQIDAQTTVPGGLGHQLYEQYRVMSPTDPQAAAIAAQSQDYYNIVRMENGG